MNKYQKSFNKYEVRDEVKARIYAKLNNKSYFKLSYALILLGVVGLISLTSVYAEEISAFFKSWTTSLKVPKDTNLNIMSKITNFDDTKLERYEDEKGGHFTIGVESDYMDVTDIEKEIGVLLIKYKDKKASYYLDGTNNKEGYVSSIGIGYEDIYKDKDDSEFATPYDLYTKQKSVTLAGKLLTKNYEDNIDTSELWLFDFSYREGETNNYQTIKLDNLGVTALYYDVGPTYSEEDTKGLGHQKLNHLFFTYDDVSYHLLGHNMEIDDFLNIAKELTV